LFDTIHPDTSALTLSTIKSSFKTVFNNRKRKKKEKRLELLNWKESRNSIPTRSAALDLEADPSLFLILLLFVMRVKGTLCYTKTKFNNKLSMLLFRPPKKLFVKKQLLEVVIGGVSRQ